MYCGFKTFKRGLIDTLGEKSDAALMGSTDRARRKLHHQSDRYYGMINVYLHLYGSILATTKHVNKLGWVDA